MILLDHQQMMMIPMVERDWTVVVECYFLFFSSLSSLMKKIQIPADALVGVGSKDDSWSLRLSSETKTHGSSFARRANSEQDKKTSSSSCLTFRVLVIFALNTIGTSRVARELCRYIEFSS